MKMKLKSWHLYVLATLCFLFAFTSLNMKYDRFYRVNGIDNDNRSLIEKYLDKEEQDYLIDHGISVDEFIDYIIYDQFHLQYYQYYNELKEAKKYDSLEILKNADLKDLKNIVMYGKRVLWGLVAFLLCFSSVVGGCCPFAVALIAVSGRKNFLFATIGSALGYIVFCSPENAIRYVSAVVICTLGTFALIFFKVKRDTYISMLIAGLSVFSTGLVMNVKAGATLGEYALTFGESVLALGSAFFFNRAVNCSLKRLKLKALPVTDLTCILVSASIVLSGLSFIEIKGVSFARIIAALLILTTVRFGRQRFGLIVSLCLGFALGITKENGLFLLGAYAFSSLLCSLFTSFSVLYALLQADNCPVPLLMSVASEA